MAEETKRSCHRPQPQMSNSTGPDTHLNAAANHNAQT